MEGQRDIERMGASIMKVLVMSDTHGLHENLDRVLEQECPCDLIIHLGDIEDAVTYIETAAGCPVEAVRGNNDYFSKLPDEKILTLNNRKILITHGHYYYVDAGIEHLMKEAHGRGVDIVMFGHTHRPIMRKRGELTALNPGSLSYPRQEGHKPSYSVMEINEKGETQIFFKFL